MFSCGERRNVQHSFRLDNTRDTSLPGRESILNSPFQGQYGVQAASNSKSSRWVPNLVTLQ